jgi:RNA-splicing ligase RtcB
MDLITGKILKLNGWPDSKIIGIARHVANQLSNQGVARGVILARLDAVRQAPGQFLADALLADLARECIRLAPRLLVTLQDAAARDEYLKKRGVTLLGGGLDESPQAYKPIDQVIAAQQELVDVIGKFTPRIVRMADESGEV